MKKLNKNQTAEVLKPIKAPFELTKEQIEFVSGGQLGSADDEYPHGLGCGCRACRRPGIDEPK